MDGTISREELKEKIERGDRFTLVETQPDQLYRHTHLPGALNIAPAGGKEMETALALLPDKNAEIVVYCASPTCPASKYASRALIGAGYTNVRYYPGGKQDWVEAGLPVEGEGHPAN